MNKFYQTKLCSLLFIIFLFQANFTCLLAEEPEHEQRQEDVQPAGENDSSDDSEGGIEEAGQFLEILEMSLDMGHPQAFMFFSNPQFVNELRTEFQGNEEFLKRLDALVEKFNEKSKDREHEEVMQQSSMMINIIQSMQLQRADFGEISAPWLLLLSVYTFYRKMNCFHEFEQGKIGQRSTWALHQVGMFSLMGMFAWNAYSSIKPQASKLLDQAAESNDFPGLGGLFPLLRSGIIGVRNVETAMSSGGSSELYAAKKEKQAKAENLQKLKNAFGKNAFDAAEKSIHDGTFEFKNPLEFFEPFDEPFQRFLEKKAINGLTKTGLSHNSSRFLVKIIARWPVHMALFKFAPMAAYHYFSSTGEDQRRAALKEAWRSAHSWFAREATQEITSFVGYDRFLNIKDWTLGIVNPSLIQKGIKEGGRWGFKWAANNVSSKQKRYYDSGFWRNDGEWKEIDFGDPVMTGIPKHVTESVISHVIFKLMVKSKLCNQTVKWIVERVKGKILDAFERRIDSQVKRGTRSIEDVMSTKQIIGLLRSEAVSQLFMFFGPELMADGTSLMVSLLEWSGVITSGSGFRFQSFLSSFMPTSSFEKFEIEASGDIFHVFDYMISKGVASLVSNWLWKDEKQPGGKLPIQGPGTRWLKRLQGA